MKRKTKTVTKEEVKRKTKTVTKKEVRKPVFTLLPTIRSAAGFKQYVESLLDKEHPGSDGNSYSIYLLGTPFGNKRSEDRERSVGAYVFTHVPEFVHPLKEAFYEYARKNTGEIILSVKRRLDELGNCWSRPVIVILNFD